MLLFDLDGFKEVNDTLGHEAGDQVLIAYAATLRRAAPQDLVARLGGDEFAILVVGDDAEIAAVGLAASVAAPYPAAAPTGLPAIAASIGIAVLRPGDAPEDLLRRADLAMYSAKRAPASRLAVFSEEMAAEADRRHLLVAALAGATARGEMRLVYQPLYRLGDGELAGAEALLRWAIHCWAWCRRMSSSRSPRTAALSARSAGGFSSSRSRRWRAGSSRAATCHSCSSTSRPPSSPTTSRWRWLACWPATDLRQRD